MRNERMTALREQRGMSQEALAMASKVSLKWVGYIERTGYRPGANLRARIASALGVSEGEVWPEAEVK